MFLLCVQWQGVREQSSVSRCGLQARALAAAVVARLEPVPVVLVRVGLHRQEPAVWVPHKEDVPCWCGYVSTASVSQPVLPTAARVGSLRLLDGAI